MPASLMDAVDALDRENDFRQAFGTIFVDDILHVKRFETARFLEHVTDWEQLVPKNWSDRAMRG